MPTELVNGFGKIYLTIEYDPIHHWVYNNWIGYQTYTGIISSADACLPLLTENACPYLLNDNRQVLGPWDHAVEWIVTSWAPRAVASGLTHFAHIVSPEALAAQSARSMLLGLKDQLQMHMFDNLPEAQHWLRTAQQAAVE
jgi:hypothetical protein